MANVLGCSVKTADESKCNVRSSLARLGKKSNSITRRENNRVHLDRLTHLDAHVGRQSPPAPSLLPLVTHTYTDNTQDS